MPPAQSDISQLFTTNNRKKGQVPRTIKVSALCMVTTMSQSSLSEATTRMQVHSAASRFSLAYQPVISIADGRRSVVAFESLLRIQGLGVGEGTAQFIAKAESDGSIVAIDRWVLSQVIALTRTRPRLSVWLNTSQLSIAHPTFVKDALAAMVAGEVMGRLSFEMTETADAEEKILAKRLEEMKVQALTVMLDDVTDGYAKRGLLLSESVAGCKLSRQTTVALLESERVRAEVQQLVKICRRLGKRIVLEGIETTDELRLAMDLDITLCQGYYFCKPASPASLLHYPQMRPVR